MKLPKLIIRNSFGLLALVRKAGRMKNKKRYKRNKTIKDYNNV